MNDAFSPSRRHCLGAGLGGAAAWLAPGWAQAAPGPLRVVQFLDMSGLQQNLSRDYATGVRLAWMPTGPTRVAHKVGLQTIEVTDPGNTTALRDMVNKLVADPGVIGLLGTTADRLAVAVHAELRHLHSPLPHIGPWMADARFDDDASLACLFASRPTQLSKSIASVRGMGMNELCVVYRSATEQALYDADIAQLAQSAQLRLQRLVGDGSPGSLHGVAARIPASSSLVLCLGNSADLAQLTQGMAVRHDRRFVLGLGDVDPAALLELRPGRGVAVLLAQVVPNPVRGKHPSIPLVSEFSARLRMLFDEEPAPVSLAGYIAGSYAAELMQKLGGRLSRESLMAETQRRANHNLHGWLVDFKEDRRGSRFVTQAMLNADGQLVG